MNKKVFSLFSVLVVFLSIVLNFLFSFLARKMMLPLYFDSLFTILATALSGLWGGIICGVLTNVALWFFDKAMLPFVLCQICTAVFTHLAFLRNKEKPLPIDPFLWAGLWSGISNGILGNTIALILLEQSENISISVQGIFVVMHNLQVAFFFNGILTNFVDKALCASLCYLLYCLLKKSLPNDIISV